MAMFQIFQAPVIPSSTESGTHPWKNLPESSQNSTLPADLNNFVNILLPQQSKQGPEKALMLMADILVYTAVLSLVFSRF